MLHLHVIFAALLQNVEMTYSPRRGYFQHYDLNILCAHVDGERFPSRSLTPDFTTGHFLEAYETLSGRAYNIDRTIDIKRQEFALGYSMYIIRVMLGEPDASTYGLVQKGSVRLELKFRDPIPSTVSAIVYAEFDSFVEIDREQNVIMDY